MNISVSAAEQTITVELGYRDFDGEGLIHGSPVFGSLLCEYLRYRDQGNPADVTLQFRSPVGSAGLCRGIFELAKLTRAAQGTLTIKGYQSDYVLSLKTLGINQMPGIVLVEVPA